MRTNRTDRRAPRPCRSARRPRADLVLHVRLSRQQRAWLDYLMDSEMWRSPEDFVRRCIQGFIESEGGLCMDPKQSPFRAWLLTREGKTSRIRCGKGYLCRPCAAQMAEMEAWLKDHAARKAVA